MRLPWSFTFLPAVPLIALVSGLTVVASPVISVQPSSLSTTLAHTFSVDVLASGVTDLFAFQFDLGFDPDVLAANAVTEGPFLAQGGSTFFIAGAIDNLGGAINSTANTLLTAVSGVSGSGTLATFQFTAVGPGSSPVNLFNLILLDSSLTGIDASVQDGSVTVTGVPEPGTVLLLFTGLLLVAGLCRRSLACVLLVVAPALCVGQVFDTTPPKLVGFSFTPTAIDVTSGPQTVTVNLHVTDDLSGVLAIPAEVDVLFRSPTTNQLQGSAFGTPLPGSLPRDANFQFVVTFPQYSESGNWTVDRVFLRDAVGNTADLNTSTLAAMSFPTILTVTSIPDTTPPTLTSLSITPSAIDVSAGPRSVTLSLGLTDSLSGALGGIVGITGPSGQMPSPSLISLSLVSGTPNAGIWSGTVVFPRYAEAGTWAIALGLFDAANNHAGLTAAQIQALGFPAGVQVTSTPTDNIPPKVTSLTITPLAVNTSTGSQTIDLNVGLSDNLSGIYFYPPFEVIFPFYFQSPSRMQGASSGFFTLNSGTLLNGQWHSSLVLPQYSEGGTWTLESVYMVDAALNHLVLNTAQLQALGLPTSFVVFQPSLTPDGSIGVAGGTVNDTVFGSRASLTFPPGVVSGTTMVAIDVLSSPLSVPTPAGFSTNPASFFTNIELNPPPTYPLAPPGLTLVLPLFGSMTPGTILSLYRLDPASGLPVPAQDISGKNIQGNVDPSGVSATFTGISRLSTVVAYLPTPGTVLGDVNGDRNVDCTDIAIVKAAFGKKTGQAGFDPRADLNHDGVIDIRDLTIVFRQLPKGISCP